MLNPDTLEAEAEVELEAAVGEAAKLQSQFPKLHRCAGGSVLSISEEMWRSWLPYTRWADPYAEYDIRHCPHCSSSLMVITKILDASQE